MRSKSDLFQNDKVVYSVLIVLLAIFAVISASGFGLEYSDQNLYYYMGKMVADGKMPYKDFFFAHPPGEILVDALVYKAFGFGLIAFKIFTLLPILASAILIFIIAKKEGNNFIGLAAASLFLFTYETIRISAGNLGVGFTVLSIMLSLYFMQLKKPFLSGISIAIGSFFTLHAIPFGIGLFLANAIIVRGRKISFRIKNGLHYLAGFLGLFILMNIAMFALAGSQYYNDAFLFHLQKPTAPVPGIKFALFKLMFQYNAPLFLFGIAAIFIALFLKHGKKAEYPSKDKDESNSDFFRGMWWVVLIYSLYLLFLSRVFPYYFFGMFPAISLLSAYYLQKAAIKIGIKTNPIAMIMLILLTANAVYGASQYYYDMKNTFSDGIIDSIEKEVANGKYIFGDYLFVPIIALQQGKEVPMGFVDTNPLRFQANTISPQEILNTITSQDEIYLILRYTNGFMLLYNETGEYLDNSCKILINKGFEMPSYFGKQMVKDKVFVLYCSNPVQVE